MTTKKFNSEDLEISRFDPVEFLDSEEAIAAYIEAAIAENDPAFFMSALNDVIRARGIAEVASKAGLGRESLYKTLKPGAEPRLGTVMRLLEALDIRLSTVPASNDNRVKIQAVRPAAKKAASPKRVAKPPVAAQQPAAMKSGTSKQAAKPTSARRPAHA